MNVMQESRNNTYTKYIMSIVVSLYFLGAVIGTLLIISAAIVDVKNRAQIDTAMFIAYAAYLGTPTATAIGFYAWKSKAENVIKIAQSKDLNDAEQEVAKTISQIGGNY